MLYGEGAPNAPLQLSGNVIELTPADFVAPPDYELILDQFGHPVYDTNKSNPKPIDPDNISSANPFGNPDVDKISGLKIVVAPTKGTITSDDQSGNFTYQAGPQFVGEDTFSYEVSDGFVFSQAATVTIKADFAEPLLYTHAYTDVVNGDFAAGPPGKDYTLTIPQSQGDIPTAPNVTTVTTTVPGLLSDARFPNGNSLAGDVSEVLVESPPPKCPCSGLVIWINCRRRPDYRRHQ